MTIDDAIDSLRHYADHGRPVGGFLTAVLSNDLMDAMGRADETSRANLYDICMYVYNDLPKWLLGFRCEGEKLARCEGSGEDCEVMTKSRALTEGEARQRFLDAVRNIVAYWAGEGGSNVPADSTPRHRVEGCAFSILVALDGGSGNLPGFRVMPSPHPGDKKFNKARGENWWPDNIDIAGSLHEELHK